MSSFNFTILLFIYNIFSWILFFMSVHFIDEQDWLSVYPLGTPGIRHIRHIDQRGH